MSVAQPPRTSPVDPDHYCRELESYLCRKNDGHLIRIAGPAFERVSDWARQGIPVTVACEGIDRYFERYYRRGPRRRPVRVEFCEADVLDAFDAWRRAVGVAREETAVLRPRPSLASHLERVIARLTTLRASSERARAFEDALERAARALDALGPRARGIRGSAREALLAELIDIDRALMRDVMGALPEATRAAADAEAREQLAPFRERMTPDAYQQALTSAAERTIREQLGLPAIAFE